MKLAIGIGVALLVVASVFGYGWQGRMGVQLIDNGTYADLVDYREQVGWQVMPWIQNEDDLEVMQQMHEWREERGGCPMWQAGFDND